LTVQLNPIIESLVQQGELFKVELPLDSVIREMDAAKDDLQDATDSFDEGKWKWATIQGYHSMLHSAHTLLYSRGYKEHDENALVISVGELFHEELGTGLITVYNKAIQLKRNAEELIFSEDGAIETIEGAKAWLNVARNILKAK
jgi:uncharacterized protein (UPF0332 family)